MEAPLPVGPMFLDAGMGVAPPEAEALALPSPLRRQPLLQRQHGRVSMEDTVPTSSSLLAAV